MATKSRTYLPTDWQVWVYTPVAGKFRLDFSALDGADVLGGSTDTGSIQPLSLRINSIQIDDGQRPDQGVFSSFIPGTLSLSAQLLSWDANTVKELYNGKQIFLTLKNEATNSHPTFGKNTVFFIGQIDNLDISVDPINQVTNLSIYATDVASSAMNFPIALTKSTTTGKSVQLNGALSNAKADGFISSYLSFSFIDLLTSTYETNTTQTKSIGDWITDYISSSVGIYVPYIYTYDSGYGLVATRVCNFFTANSLVKNGELIPESIIGQISVSQDGANVPNAFNLTNSTATYSYGTTTANTTGNPTIYSAQIDVPTSQLQTIANQISQYSQKIQPTQVTVRTAQSFQQITFDNTRPFGAFSDYVLPKYFWVNGQEVKTMPTYTGGTYYHMVVGTSHTIDVDGWTTTYQLWKGL